MTKAALEREKLVDFFLENFCSLITQMTDKESNNKLAKTAEAKTYQTEEQIND